MTIWFTADTHLGHSRIIKYTKRPFSSHEEMEEVMLERFNSRLKRGDTLYHLGDISWSNYPLERFFPRLNTHQCQLILGNHDTRKESEYRRYFCWVGHYKSLSVGGHHLALLHYPMRSWVGKGNGVLHLYGHCHGSLEPGLGRSMDVGVDTNNFYPYSLEEVIERLKDRPLFDPGERAEQAT